MLGVGLLLPGLILAPPAGDAAETTVRPAAKRPDPKPRTSERKMSATVEPAESCVHVVRSGDSVSRLAVRYRVSRQRIIDANRLARPEALRVGQRLTVPGCDPDRAATPVTVAAPVTQPDGSVLAVVGPRRIPTRLFMTEPEFAADEAVDFVWPVMGPVVSAMGARRRCGTPASTFALTSARPSMQPHREAYTSVVPLGAMGVS